MYWLIVGLGAGLGAILRAWLARFNNIASTSLLGIPLGTLSANVLGGLLMGIALVYSERLSPTLRGLVTTGFLGGLTTFSTFSAETFTLLQQGRIVTALALIGLHVGLTLLATAIGFYAIKGLALS